MLKAQKINVIANGSEAIPNKKEIATAFSKPRNDTNRNFRKQVAFTLAEVLITLGIIGVVAAMTIPGLIHNYKKRVVATKLKTTYAQLQQCFRRSVAENGDMDGWVQEFYKNQDAVGASSSVPMGDFIQTYMVPYMSGATFGNKEMTIGQLGFKNGMKYSNGSNYLSSGSKVYSVTMKNGSILTFGLQSYYNTKTRKYEYLGMQIRIAVNGASTRAMVGRDIFVFLLSFKDNTLKPLSCEYVNYSTGICLYDDTKRENILNRCKNSGEGSRVCAALIQMDGWKIANDYPWL